MANIFTKLVSAVLHPNREQESAELRYLREVYQNNQPGARKPNTWSCLANESGNVVGFHFICGCFQEYTLLGVEQWLAKSYDCGACKRPIDLCKSLGVTSDTTLADLRQKLLSLPIQPSATQRPSAAPVVDTWDDTAGTVSWEGNAYTADLSSGDPFAASFRK